MKLKTISRTEDITGLQQRLGDIPITQRNLTPEMHPFSRAREYTRALNAVKLERLFAKPFLHALPGHIDGVYALAKHPTSISTIISGSGDGELRVWDTACKTTVWSTKAHEGFVRGIACVPFSQDFATVGQDKTVKMWNTSSKQPKSSYASRFAFTGIDHHRSKQQFVTSSTRIDLWDHERAEPIQTMEWGSDTIKTVKLNQTETSILASTGSDRTVILYDLRTSSPISKSILRMQSNAIAWNPIEAFNFTIANEDHNLYTFDMRNLAKALNVLKDHVSAVLDVDYSPTGQEIVSGGYDKTLRIFSSRQGHSRDVYHTKRMQKIFCTKYSMDGKHIYSGSDDGNVRVWKNVAHERLGVKSHREIAAQTYTEALKERYKHMPEINRIDKHRKMPKGIKKAAATKAIQNKSQKRKLENVIKHTKPGSVSRVPNLPRYALSHTATPPLAIIAKQLPMKNVQHLKESLAPNLQETRAKASLFALQVISKLNSTYSSIKIPSLCAQIAQFYIQKSLCYCDKPFYDLAAACLSLALKEHIRLKELIKAVMTVALKQDKMHISSTDKEYKKWNAIIIHWEVNVLEYIKCEIGIDSHTQFNGLDVSQIVDAISTIDDSRVTSMAKCIVLDTLSSRLCLEFSLDVLAAAGLYIASRNILGIRLESMEWNFILDERILHTATKKILELYFAVFKLPSRKRSISHHHEKLLDKKQRSPPKTTSPSYPASPQLDQDKKEEGEMTDDEEDPAAEIKLAKAKIIKSPERRPEVVMIPAQFLPMSILKKIQI